MFNLDEEKIEFSLGNRALVFWQGKKAENVVFFISDVLIRGIYLSLTLGTAKLKKINYYCSLPKFNPEYREFKMFLPNYAIFKA